MQTQQIEVSMNWKQYFVPTGLHLVRVDDRIDHPDRPSALGGMGRRRREQRHHLHHRSPNLADRLRSRKPVLSRAVRLQHPAMARIEERRVAYRKPVW